MRWGWLCALLLTGCPAGGGGRDAGDRGRDAEAATDAGGGDVDGGRDAGPVATDAGVDAGRDAGPMDAGPSMCDLPTACVPDAVEEGAVCGRCGVEARRCNASCVWTPFECAEDAARCDLWVRPDDGAWTGYTLRSSADAPATDVVAAVALDGTGEGLVLTETTWHRFRRSCEPGVSECWTSSGALGDLFPEVIDALRFADDVPEAYRMDGLEGIDLRSATTEYRYTYDVAAGTFAHVTTGPGPAPSPGTPTRSAVRASFTVLGNTAGWLVTPCGDPSTVPADYILTIETTDVFVFTPGDGCMTFHQEPYATWGPFDEAGAPPIERVAATFHRGGLWVFAP